jgi:hypothetical protein
MTADLGNGETGAKPAAGTTRSPATSGQRSSTDSPSAASVRRYPDLWLTAPRRLPQECRVVDGPNLAGYYKIKFRSPDGPWEDTRYVRYVKKVRQGHA